MSIRQELKLFVLTGFKFICGLIKDRLGDLGVNTAFLSSIGQCLPVIVIQVLSYS